MGTLVLRLQSGEGGKGLTEMTDRESAYVFAEFAYPTADIENSLELQAAFVNGWATRMRRDDEYGLAQRIEEILSDDWIKGRVLLRYVGAESDARLGAIRKVIDEYFGRA